MGAYGFDLVGRLEERERRTLRRDLGPADAVSDRARFAADPRGEPPVFEDGEAAVFASNNYLGLADHPAVQRAGANAARDVGTGAGASRLVTGDTAVHRALERDLAACRDTERALAFSSGYAANVGTIDALDPDVVFSDELNHASIIDGCRLSEAETVVYDHCDAADLDRRMATRADEAADGASWLVVTDTVFSMRGDVAPVASLCDVADEYGAWVMVDEAHATGLFGDGGGIVQRQGVGDRVDVQLGTLSKALASQGGYVAGEASLVEVLLNEARSFAFSTGLAPPAAAAAREALQIARDSDRVDRLWDHVERLRAGLESMGYEVLGESHVLPVLVGDREDALDLAAGLRERGIVAPAIRSPSVPVGTARIRVTPMATHSDEDVERCLSAFRAAGEVGGIL